MIKFCGKGVSSGTAIGKIFVSEKDEQVIRRVKITDTDAEKERLNTAKEKALSELSEIHKEALGKVGETGAQIFEIHMMMLEDDDYNESIYGLIDSQKVNAEYAVAVTCENFSKMFDSATTSYMKARKADIKDVSERLIAHLTGNGSKKALVQEGAIVCASDMSPTETVSLDKKSVLGFATSFGSYNSHTAILARSMNIPAVIGLGEDFLSKAKKGESIVIDGDTGKVYIDPNEKILREAKERQDSALKRREMLKSLRSKENVTKNGKKIDIFANIGSLNETGEVLYNDAGGIGLFRSEFLYLEGKTYPTEQDQFEVYKSVLERMAGRKTVIRTLDIGADKRADYFGIAKEENPALGFRAIRICLTRPEIFKTQLRALYRASAYGKLSIMFPLITNAWEVEKCLEMCNEVKKELKEENIPFNENVEIGIMIETPAAALISDILAPMVDFFSVGTNDLTQYALACDRQNENVEPFCDTHHVAVMRLIKYACESIHKSGGWIGICGELASDTSLTKEFLNMGIDEISVSPSKVLEMREKVRSL